MTWIERTAGQAGGVAGLPDAHRPDAGPRRLGRDAVQAHAAHVKRAKAELEEIRTRQRAPLDGMEVHLDLGEEADAA
ncbi:hypothetical protein GCM10010412_049250 [Nonomuraea recticatena]|uniref:Uncharacterized protein n=1 Tax=Nonomuraea recticatena TaxID=46178 RepID=A0ABP6EKQ1_9ACTN